MFVSLSNSIALTFNFALILLGNMITAGLYVSEKAQALTAHSADTVVDSLNMLCRNN